MRIKWFGHSAFLLTSEAGTRVLIDPYYKFLGYRMPVPVETDIVVVTHNHGNIIFRFRMDGLSICHCGDLGHLLTEEQVKESAKRTFSWFRSGEE